MKKTILLITACIACAIVNAQAEPQCGTEMTPESLVYFEQLQPTLQQYEQEFYQLSNQRNSLSAVNSVPIKAHIIRNDNGTGGLSESNLNSAIAIMNQFYANAYVEFFLCDGINYIDDSNFYNFSTSQESALTSPNNVSNVINIYFANSVSTSTGGGLCGYTYLPGGPETILMNNSCTMNGSTLAHEMGHFFGLPHTHGYSNTTLTTELVDGSNCENSGDYICDTPADPKLGYSTVNGACDYTGNATDANGDTFVPDTNNVMSYARQSCRNQFSIGQYARIYAVYEASRSAMTCPSISVEMTANYTTGCNSDMNVDFTDNSNGATSWSWDVDGDNTVDYTTQNPSHTYEDAGTYDVILTISDGNNTLTRVYDNHIVIGSENISTSEVTLTLSLDDFPADTSWNFKDANGNVIYSNPTYVEGTDDFETFTYNFDLIANSCYSFEILDAFGDGICCNAGDGSYILTSAEGVQIAAGGAEIESGKLIYLANDALLGTENYFKANALSVYPNPTNDVLNISLDNTSNLPEDYTIYNMLGQVVASKTVQQTQDLSINTNTFNEGIYYLKLSKGTDTTTISFIKE
ncbi:MAG: T9SS type A sorting domain-containing protein [Psychroserpens sp.]|uniref:T9SS type A sorting domain-containing protein n=1 Tax=Psychroserpens sp. TaxID=2020870 RepID=UPI003C791DB8